MLLQLNVKTASSVIGSFNFDGLRDDLAKNGYAGTLADLRKKVAEIFRVPPEKALASARELRGDIFFLGDSKLLYLKCQVKNEENESGADDVFADPGQTFAQTRVTLEAGLIAGMGEADLADLDAFCDSVTTILEVSFSSPEIKWLEPEKKKVKRPAVDGKNAATPAESEIELAGMLRDGKLDPLFAAIREKNGQLVIDEWLKDRKDAEEVEYFIDKLFEADFFEEELIVYNADNQPVFRAKDRASLEALKKAGIRDLTGAELDISRVRRLILMPPEKEKLLSLSWQARIFLIDLLFKVGLTNKDILNLPGVGELELMLAYLDNEPILFAFSSEAIEAEAFAKLTGLLGTLDRPHVVAVTQAAVDADGAQAAGAASCVTIRNLNEFNTKLLDLFSARRAKAIEAAMADFNKMISLNVAAMSLGRLSG